MVWLGARLIVGFRTCYSASFSSYSLVYECTRVCIPYINVHANILSLTACVICTVLHSMDSLMPAGNALLWSESREGCQHPAEGPVSENPTFSRGAATILNGNITAIFIANINWL